MTLKLYVTSDTLFKKVILRARDVTQLVERLSSLHEALGLIPSTTQTRSGAVSSFKIWSQEDQKFRGIFSYTEHPRLAWNT